MSIEPDAAQIRVVGCLLEKQRTTPEAYPLSVNSLRLACNQSTNRHPVVEYDEHTVLDALEHLGRLRWTRLSSGAGTRARKYRHLIGEALAVGEPELALLCVLMLRGPQTPGELKQRTERLHRFADLAAIHEALAGLTERGHVRRLERRPGQKEERYEQLLGGDGSGEAAAQPGANGPAPAPPVAPLEPAAPRRDERLDRLEVEVGRLRTEVARLRAELGG